MLTLNKVNKAISENVNEDVELVKGNGYFYLIGKNDSGESLLSKLKSTSIYVNSLNQQDLISWIVDVKIMLAKVGGVKC